MNDKNEAKKLMQEYQDVQKLVQEDLTFWPVATKGGKISTQNEAKERLPQLVQRYTEVIKAGIFAVFLEGPLEAQQAWALTAETEAQMITVTADGLYETLTAVVEPSMGDRRTFGTSQLGMLIRSMNDVGKELGMRSLTVPSIDDLRCLKTHEETKQYIRNLIRGSSQDRLNLMWLENEVIKKALAIRYTRSVVPVILVGADESEIDGLSDGLFSKAFRVKVVSTQTDRDAVLKKLTEIRAELQKKS